MIEEEDVVLNTEEENVEKDDAMKYRRSSHSFYEKYEDSIALDLTLKMKRGASNSENVEEENSKTFGTAFGVYLPCTQNILGVLLFIRLPWIVSQAGMVFTTLVVVLCVSATVLTTLSMSALATNGKVKAGGPYAILVTNLGPEFGGSIGFLFYLGTTIAGTMYALGGVEAMFANFVDGELFSFDREIISLCWTLLLGGIVYAGMKWVSKVSFSFLLIVISAVFFMSLGTILFAADAWNPDDIYPVGNLKENMWSNYTVDEVTGRVPTFTSLIALFFPSVTGIMAGSNRSGVLKSPGRSIPKGTLGAIMTTTTIYIFTIWLFGLTVSNYTLKTNKLVTSFIAWPHQYVVGVGIIMSCIGAGLQSLAGAPQLLKSMANDGHIAFLRFFKTDKPDDEPRKAVIFTTILAALFCLAGNLDYITPILTMFFLCMYAGINFACFLAAFLKSPNFRPTWKYFHWLTALLGFLDCVALMFVISVLYAFIALFIVILIFFYIRGNRDKKEWGDALFGLRLEQAMNALLDLSDITEARRKAKQRKRKKRRSSAAKLLNYSSTSNYFPSSPSVSTKNNINRGWCQCLRFRKKATTKTVAEQQNNDSPESPDLESSSSSSSKQYNNNYYDKDYDYDFQEESNMFEEDEAFGEQQQRNWRPQILVLCKLFHVENGAHKTFQVTQPPLLQLASQLKKGKGLTCVVSVLHGDVLDGDSKLRCAAAKRFLRDRTSSMGMRAFSDVILGSGPNLLEPFRVLFQTKGIGLLSPNTVMVGWPSQWRTSSSSSLKSEKNLVHKNAFTSMLKDAIGCQKALIVVKCSNILPIETVSEESTIDVWWLIHDGDMLVLLPYLLQRHKVWEKAKLRIFAIADELVDPNSYARIEEHLAELRISAQVQVVTISSSHARDVDQNRTVLVKPTTTKDQDNKTSILNTDMFQPLTPVEEGDGLGEEEENNNNNNYLHSTSPKPTRLYKRRLSGGKSSRRNSFEKKEHSNHSSKKHLAAEVEQIAKQIKSSSGQETQKWIQNKYKGKSNNLASMFEQPISEEEEEEVSKPEDKNNSPFLDGCNVEDPYIPELQSTSYKSRQQILLQKQQDLRRLEKRLTTAKYLNEKIKENSSKAKLIVLNLPLSRVTPTVEFVDYTTEMTKDLENVVMLRGHGTEKISL